MKNRNFFRVISSGKFAPFIVADSMQHARHLARLALLRLSMESGAPLRLVSVTACGADYAPELAWNESTPSGKPAPDYANVSDAPAGMRSNKAKAKEADFSGLETVQIEI